MIQINLNKLNSLEVEIHSKLQELSKTNSNIKITQAAEYCSCSVSKISKFVKKLGFSNYKQYLDFLYGRSLPDSGHSNELNRISLFINDFDFKKVEELTELIENHEKIILFGFGPSFMCARYFEYRLRTSTNKLVMAFSDEISVASMTDSKSLLIILTVTGSFRSFKDVYEATKAKGCEVAMVVEEYNTDLFNQCDKIFFLSEFRQPENLKPYEKSRTVLFIFLEEVVQSLMRNKVENQI